MKKIIFALFILFSLCSYSQSYKKEGNNFTQVTTRQSSQGTKTKFTFTDSKNNTYPIYITDKGRCYIMKISGKTGKEYKYYLKEDLSRQVCKELNIIYVPKDSSNKK